MFFQVKNLHLQDKIEESFVETRKATYMLLVHQIAYLCIIYYIIFIILSFYTELGYSDSREFTGYHSHLVSFTNFPYEKSHIDLFCMENKLLAA